MEAELGKNWQIQLHDTCWEARIWDRHQCPPSVLKWLKSIPRKLCICISGQRQSGIGQLCQPQGWWLAYDYPDNEAWHSSSSKSSYWWGTGRTDARQWYFLSSYDRKRFESWLAWPGSKLLMASALKKMHQDLTFLCMCGLFVMKSDFCRQGDHLRQEQPGQYCGHQSWHVSLLGSRWRGKQWGVRRPDFGACHLESVAFDCSPKILLRAGMACCRCTFWALKTYKVHHDS